MSKVLTLRFTDQAGDPMQLSVDNAREDITADEVRTAMDAVIGRNVFETKAGQLTGIKSAVMVEKTETVLI